MAATPKIITVLLLLANLFLGASTSFAQVINPENPPIPIKVEVNSSQSLHFGAFTAGASIGTVTVDYSGIRSSTGGVTLLHFGMSPSNGLFDLTANPGTIINIHTPGLVNLYLESGGTSASGFVQLEINSFSTGQTFITTASPPVPNPIAVGGTLYINPGAPAGTYQGMFTLTFNHE